MSIGRAAEATALAAAAPYDRESLPSKAGRTDESPSASPVNLRGLGRGVLLGTGAAAWCGIGVTGAYFGYAFITGPEPGHIREYQPPIDTFPEPRNSVTAYSWNIEHKDLGRNPGITRQIAGFATSKADVIFIQEITSQDVPYIEEALPSYSIRHVVADEDQDDSRGGLGNLTATRRPQRDVKSRQLSGTSTTETAARMITDIKIEKPRTVKNVARLLSGSWEESRAILGVTTDVYSHNTKRPIQFINTHISARKQRDSLYPRSMNRVQMAEVKQFVKDALEEDVPTILCADFNTGAYDVHTTFADLGMLTVDPDRATTVSGLIVDRCVYYHAGVLGLGRTQVLNTKGSDHQAIKTRWRLTTPKD